VIEFLLGKNGFLGWSGGHEISFAKWDGRVGP
jgi:hypothetical protein